MVEVKRIFDKKGAYENFYAGSYTPFQPEFGEYFTGYRVPQESIGAPTSITTADQLRQASRLLNTGMKIVEAGAIDPKVFDAIPKQHFAEIRRQAQLVDADITLHGPIIEPSGIGEGGWREEERKKAERIMYDVLEKAHDLDPKGNVPVTFHAGAVPIQHYRYLNQAEREKLLQDYPNSPPEVQEQIKRGVIRDYMLIVDQETGQIQPVKWDEKIWPEGKIIFDPKRRAEMINVTEWDNKGFELAIVEEQKARLARMIPAEEYGRLRERIASSHIDPYQVKEKVHKNIAITPEEAEVFNDNRNLEQLEAPLRESNFREYMSLREMYNDYIKFGPKEGREVLEREAKKIVTPEEAERIKRGEYSDKVLNELRNVMIQLPAPQKWKPGDEFAADKVAETVGNATAKAFKKFGDKTPIVALENFPDTVVSTAEEAKRLIKLTRERFVEAAKREGIPEVTAQRAAEKLIGVTWDFGHSNMMRRYGFPPEFVTEETAKVAELIKKTHITDNFGFEDAHLPPGMGNIPYKEALAELEKRGVKVPQIVEAAGFFQHFKTSPHPYVLEALGSSLYTYEMVPYWNQLRATYASYFSGYGEFMPDFHFKAYGSPSFSALPSELGGEMPGERRERFGPQGLE